MSCQNLPAGFYTAYQDLMRHGHDFVLHLGDYIYEGGGNGAGAVRRLTRRYEATTLDDYRVRHADYKSAPDLQAVNAAFPFVVTWDDHDVENNHAGSEADPDVPAEEFSRVALRRTRPSTSTSRCDTRSGRSDRTPGSIAGCRSATCSSFTSWTAVSIARTSPSAARGLPRGSRPGANDARHRAGAVAL